MRNPINIYHFILILTIGLWIGLINFIYDYYHPYGNCMPATVHRIFPNHSEMELRKMLHSHRSGTCYTNLYTVWPKLTTNKLVAIYSIMVGVDSDYKTDLEYNKPYLWLGLYKGVGHCAIAMFTKTNVLLSNSIFYTDTTNYVVNKFSQEEFFTNTYILYTSPALDNIRFY